MNKDPRKNASGCPDPTAYEALKNLTKEQDVERLNRLLSTIRYISDMAGFEIMERIIFRDKKNGKIWR